MPAEPTTCGNSQPSEETQTVSSIGNDAVEPQDQDEQRQITLPKRNPVSWALIVVAILSSVFLFALDNTITANLIPVILEQFGESEKLPWLSVTFLMGGVSAVLPGGQLYSLFNARSLYVGAVVLFLGGSALCGGAPNLNAFIVGRAIAGVGGIGMYLGVMTLLSINTSPARRPMYFGLVGLVFGIGNVVGPVIGGAFADSKATWRWGFYINLCIIGILSPVYLFLIPSFEPQPGKSIMARLRIFDSVGTILSVATLVCFIMAVNFGGTLYLWNGPQIIVLFILAGIIFLGFIIQQMLTIFTSKATRLFPAVMLKDKEAVLLFILCSTFNSANFVPIYYVPLYFQFTRGDGPLDSAVRLLPLIVFTSFLVIINGGALSKGGYYMPWFLVGSILVVPAGVLFSRLSVDTSAAYVYGAEVLIGIGSGCGIQAAFAVIQAVTKPELMQAGIAFIMISQLLSVSLALSIGGTIFINTALRGLMKVLPYASKAELEAVLLGTAGGFLKNLPESVKQSVLNVIVSSLDKVFILSYVAAVVGILAALCLRRTKMAGVAAA